VRVLALDDDFTMNDKRMIVDDNVIRTADERAMRRLLRRGARILAEYNWQGSGVAELEARGREWIVQVPKPQMMQHAA
jgi:hypothetical protein